MRILSTVCLASLITVWSMPASSQSIAIGANPQGSLGYAIAAGVAVALSKHTTMTVRPVGFGGATTFMPRIDAGLLEMGANNVIDAVYARRGIITYKKPHPNIRIVSRLVPFQAGIMVRNDSDIKTIQDLKGRRFSTEYSRMKIAEANTGAMIATVGLTWSDFKPVPVSNFVRGIQLLVQGKVDGTNAAPGSGINREANAKVPMRFLSLPNTPASRRILQEHVPGAYFDLVRPAKRMPAVRSPVTLLGFPYLLVVGAHVDDEVVYRTAKALYGARADLIATHGIFRGFSPDKMVVDTAGVPYHPGAIKFYREKGMWPPKSK